ncbi:MAG TPA: PKD domain-containing protein [Acidimicrobiales bacterium]|nr:PKD domain-containing protein [Acidimicrobiales bacterium]
MGRSRGEVTMRGEPSEDGFTLVELIVALTMLALALLSLSYGMYSGMNALQVARHKTSFLELANAEVEKVRALNYDDAGVNGGTVSPDPNLATAYPGNQFEGRDAVIFNPARAGAVAAVIEVTTSPTPGLIAPYTIRRWVTWTDDAGGTSHKFKRVDVKIEWTERGRPQDVRYSSLYYPGNLGAPAPAAGDLPTAAFVVCPASTCSGAPSTPALGRANFTQFSVNNTSSDPNGLALTYSWNWGDCDINSGGCLAVGASPGTHTYAQSGHYTIILTVQNTATPQGFATATREVLVGVDKPNGPPETSLYNLAPTASFTTNYVSSPIPSAPLRVTANGGASTDPDGDPLLYTYSWGDGLTTTGTAAAPTHNYTNGGVFNLTLVVSDPGGRSSPPVSRLITIGTTGCTISSVVGDNFFKNPAANTINNRIRVTGAGRPQDLDFLIEVKTNAFCTGASLSIPQSTGSFVTTLTEISTVGNTRLWRATASVGATVRFNSGTQSATISGTGPTGNGTQVLTFTAGTGSA